MINSNKPFNIFADVVEDGALKQFQDTMDNEYVISGALMPDVHQGYTVPIGCVFKSDGMIFPSAVGYDISCSVSITPIRANIKDIRFKANKIHKQIFRNVPVGFNNRKRSHYSVVDIDDIECSDVLRNIFNEFNSALQIGTLGGGNHFCSVDYDDNDQCYIQVHSGSRGLGHKVASYYMREANPDGKLSEGLYGFDVNSDIGKDYIKDISFCNVFAELSHKVMIREVVNSFREVGIECSCNFEDMIISNHNNAISDDGVHWIHRKGVTEMKKDMMGVIPGNMRDGSFIVRGLGNEDSLCSSSHGAGRVLGRRKAKETLDIDEFKLEMDGIIANVDRGTLDESPMAYKDIFDVMRLQEGLVETITHVKPILNVKG